MHDVACEFVRAAVRSKDAQKQLGRASLSRVDEDPFVTDGSWKTSFEWRLMQGNIMKRNK